MKAQLLASPLLLVPNAVQAAEPVPGPWGWSRFTSTDGLPFTRRLEPLGAQPPGLGRERRDAEVEVR